MKFEQKAWAKALLSSYSYLENICGSINKKVVSYGIGSASNRDTEFVASKIISLIDRKKFLINTKVLVDKALCNLEAEYARVLVLKFIDKIKVEVAAKAMNMSLRTYFRKVELAVDKFASYLLSCGYDDNKIYQTYKNESWILEIYKSYLDKYLTENKQIKKNEKLDNRFTDGLNKNYQFGLKNFSAMQC